MLKFKFNALNTHKFGHNFQCISPICDSNTGIEDNAYFFLQHPLFDPMRNDLLEQLSYLSELDLSNIDSQASLKLLLYGSPTINESDNQIMLEASIG